MSKNIRIILFSVCAFTVALFIIVLGVEYISSGFKKLNRIYTYLGDSISAGYALPDYIKDGVAVPESFGQKFGKEIGAAKINNLAVSGSKTEDLLKQLEEESCINAVKASSIITVSIGSNDILKPGLKIVFNSVNAENETEFSEKIRKIENDKLKLFVMIDKASNTVKDEKSKEILLKCVDEFETNFTEIIDKIKALNKAAVIIVESFYNPYKDFVYENGDEKIIDFGDTVQTYIDKMNYFIFNHDYNNEKYFISDISSLQTDKTNVVLDFEKGVFSFDPHPNTDGHDFIFKQTLSVYNKQKDSQ